VWAPLSMAAAWGPTAFLSCLLLCVLCCLTDITCIAARRYRSNSIHIYIGLDSLYDNPSCGAPVLLDPRRSLRRQSPMTHFWSSSPTAPGRRCRRCASATARASAAARLLARSSAARCCGFGVDAAVMWPPTSLCSAAHASGGAAGRDGPCTCEHRWPQLRRVHGARGSRQCGTTRRACWLVPLGSTALAPCRPPTC
jgi:hypothetical protein